MGLESLIMLLVYLLIGGVIIWGAIYLLDRSGLPQPFRTIVIVIIALIAIMFLLRLLGMM